MILGIFHFTSHINFYLLDFCYFKWLPQQHNLHVPGHLYIQRLINSGRKNLHSIIANHRILFLHDVQKDNADYQICKFKNVHTVPTVYVIKTYLPQKSVLDINLLNSTFPPHLEHRSIAMPIAGQYCPVQMKRRHI
jgi:hypothetical protein